MKGAVMVIKVRKVLRNALRTLQHQRDRLDEQIRQVEAALGGRSQPTAKPKRRMKASTRRLLSAQMKERWAAAGKGRGKVTKLKKAG
jgi:hypothetical protein